MGQISSKLAARFRDAGKYRRPIREEAKKIRESPRIPTDVKSIEQCVQMGLDPLHAAYASVQNFVAFFAEVVSGFDELDEYHRILSAALEEYLPEGPPMSPLTGSYFSTWAFFDLRLKPDQETIGTCLLDIGNDLGMNEGMLEVTRRFQESRMGIYEHLGVRDGRAQLKELLTDVTFACHVPAGYQGRKGELWYARLCPPIVDLIDYHIVLTTPYVLLNASKADWTAYLNKNIVGAGDTRQALHDFLKFGLSLHHWNEFVFQAYHHHLPEVIFLAGLPDVKGSLPHASNREDVMTPPASGSKSATAYQIKVTLKGIKPPIWRRLLVPDCTLDDLHEVIQIAMGWETCHLYAFRIGRREFTHPEMDDGELNMADATSINLSEVITGIKQKIGYQYDFGDDWRHEIVVEKIGPAESGQKYPLCVKGSRACPPEDVGGPWGYAEYLEAMADPRHERHEEFKEWRGEFDAEAFDLAAVNTALQKLSQ